MLLSNGKQKKKKKKMQQRLYSSDGTRGERRNSVLKEEFRMGGCLCAGWWAGGDLCDVRGTLHTPLFLIWQMFFPLWLGHLGPLVGTQISCVPPLPQRLGDRSAVAFDVYVSKHGSLFLKKDVSWVVQLARGWEKTDIISKEAEKDFIITSLLK